MVQTAPAITTKKSTRVRAIVLGAAWLIALGFVIGFALPYFGMNPEKFGSFWQRRFWLVTHLASGMVALLVGPFVLRMGLARTRMALHRRLGMVYILSVAFSSVAALYLAVHNDVGWVYGVGLSGLVIAWVLTTVTAFIAIQHRQISQHQEWMIRSYVATFAFVNFRIIVGLLVVFGVGSMHERFTVASWLCWSLPLLITEAILQGRKILAPPVD
jgi:hypothetical protein